MQGASKAALCSGQQLSKHSAETHAAMRGEHGSFPIIEKVGKIVPERYPDLQTDIVASI